MKDLEAVRIGDTRWHVLPPLREQLIGPNGLRLDEWLRTGQARLIKSGPHRKVYAVSLPDLCFYVKHNRLPDWRAWVRALLRPSKARSEFRRALDVAARQVPTVLPLAIGERRTALGTGESYLITRGLDGATPLDHFIAQNVPDLDRLRQTRLRQRLACALGVFLARLHEAGIVHDDLHAGNLLVRLGDWDAPQLYLIDLPSVRLSNPLDWSASRANLVVLNRWFSLHSSRTDRLRFWRAYEQARGSLCQLPRHSRVASRDRIRDLISELEDQTHRSNLRFWRRRDRRCGRRNRYYQRIRSPGVVGHVVADLDRAVVSALLADPDAPFRQPGVKILKASRSSTVVEFDLRFGGRAHRVVYKRCRSKSALAPWLSLVRSPPVLRSWFHGHGLRERGLPTPRPLAVLHRRRGGLLADGYLLTLKVSDAVELPDFLDGLTKLSGSEHRRILRQRIEQAARLIRELHQRHVSHRDLKGANILTTRIGSSVPILAGLDYGTVNRTASSLAKRAADLCIIDLAGVSFHRRLLRARRVQNLARLNASVGRHPALTRTDLLRFLRVYLPWGLRGPARWKDWWRAVEKATRDKIAMNIRNGRPLH